MVAVRAHRTREEAAGEYLAVLEGAALGEWRLIVRQLNGRGPRRVLPIGADPSLAELLEAMEAHRIRQCWIHDSALEGMGWSEHVEGAVAREEVEAEIERAREAGWTVRGNPHEARAHGWITAWRTRGVFGTREIYAPSCDARMPWRLARDGAALLEAISRYNVAVGAPFVRSPGRTAMGLLRSLHGPHSAALEDPAGSIGLPMVARESNTERGFSWARVPSEEERARPWLVVLDKNAMYLAACGPVVCGIGRAEAIDEPLTLGDKRLELPGYFLVQPTDDLLFPELPDPVTGEEAPVDYYNHDTGPEWWVAQPTLRLLLDTRRVMGARHAYVWPQQSRALSGWYERLRDARAELLAEEGEAARIAGQAVKMTYTHGLGWLDGYWMRDGAEVATLGLYRPHWRHAVIATARANLYRNLMKAAAAGVSPFAVLEDACAFLVDDAGCEILARCLPLGVTLAGYKLVVKAPASVADWSTLEGIAEPRACATRAAALINAARRAVEVQ